MRNLGLVTIVYDASLPSYMHRARDKDRISGATKGSSERLFRRCYNGLKVPNILKDLLSSFVRVFINEQRPVASRRASYTKVLDYIDLSDAARTKVANSDVYSSLLDTPPHDCHGSFRFWGHRAYFTDGLPGARIVALRAVYKHRISTRY